MRLGSLILAAVAKAVNKVFLIFSNENGYRIFRYFVSGSSRIDTPVAGGSGNATHEFEL